MLEDRRPNFKTWELIANDRVKCVRCGYQTSMNQAKRMAIHDAEKHKDLEGLEIYNELVQATGKARMVVGRIREARA